MDAEEANDETDAVEKGESGEVELSKRLDIERDRLRPAWVSGTTQS